MQILKSNKLLCVDVDETLALFNQDPKEMIPVTVFDFDYINDKGETETFPGFTQFVKPNQEVIEYMRKFKSEAGQVIVWSQKGDDWAYEVVKTFGIEDLVDLVMSKPSEYYDDLPCTEWMGKRLKP